MFYRRLFLFFLCLFVLGLYSGRKKTEQKYCFTYIGKTKYSILMGMKDAYNYSNNRDLSVKLLFKKLDTVFLHQLFGLSLHLYYKTFDTEVPAVVSSEDHSFYRGILKGVILLRKDLFPGLVDSSCLYEFVYHADYEMLLFFVQNAIPEDLRSKYLNTVFVPRYKFGVENLLDLVRDMKQRFYRHVFSRVRYELVEKFLIHVGVFGSSEAVGVLSKLNSL